MDELLREVFKRNEPYTRVDPERLAVLGLVFNQFTELFGVRPEMDANPVFTSGGIILKVSGVDLDREKAQKLDDILSNCINSEITALLDGSVEITASVSGVFKLVE